MNKNAVKVWIENALAENPNLPGTVQTYRTFQKETGIYDYSEDDFKRMVRKLKQQSREESGSWSEDDYVKTAAKSQKRQDQNNVLRKENRETYRLYNTLEDMYEQLLEKISGLQIKCPSCNPVPVNKGKAGILTLADLHVNEIISPCDTNGNSYNYEVFSQRLKKFVTEAIFEFQHREITEVYVFMLGDFINSPRRLDERVNMQSSLTNACLLAVDVLSQAVLELAQYFNVHIAYCVGNESRITEDMYSSKILAMENWDYLIFFIMKNALSGKGIDFIEVENPIQSLIPIALGNGKVFNAFITHGHIFKGMPTEKTVGSILQNYARQGICLHGMFLGHFHNTRIGDFIQVSGSMKGGDAWSYNDMGFVSRASQNIYFVNSDASLDAMRIDLQGVGKKAPMYALPGMFNTDASISNKSYTSTVTIKNLI